MSYLCDRICDNKTEYGYCKTTYCIYPSIPNTAVGYVPTKPKTNADRIRSMTDEEIADWYWWMLKHVQGYTDSRLALSEWLKKEAEDGSLTV